jgi:amino acid adenylation domain-containing protein
MSSSRLLPGFFNDAVERFPDQIAVVEPNQGSLTYRELDQLSDRVRNRLHAIGVRTGDRVGIVLRKSIDTVAAIYGILKAGAAYVPVEYTAPAARNAYIMQNCGVKAVVIEESLQAGWSAEASKLGPLPVLFSVPGAGGGGRLREALERADAVRPAPDVADGTPDGNDLAYILYTSGSTGKPKGVMLTHENAVSFVDWCSEVFEPVSSDRFSSHAPFHFDLSILDLYVPLKHGATLVLVPDDIGKDARRLGSFIAETRITCWYSAPSILSLLAQFGNLQDCDLSALRIINFAGEVFPVRHLRSLTQLLPHPRYFNLYGPTETNVCNFYEVPLPVAEDRTVPFPIGKVCSHLTGKAVDEAGNPVQPLQEGELVIRGPAVTQGYWSLPELTAKAFLTDPDGVRWYRTGDIVVEQEDGNYVYLGRRDRMVKKRGYRIELGEIEACLYKHAAIKEAAVVATTNDDAGVHIKAFLSAGDAKRPSMIELKRFCSENLLSYMIPDQFVWCDALPKTSTDKTDYQRLKEMV